jgi:hypothetical protein
MRVRGRMTIGRRAVLAVLGIALVGCTTPGSVLAGKDFDYGLAKREKIVKGVTTKAEIQSMYGDPYHANRAGSSESWEYYSRTAGHDGAFADRTLVIEFNERAVVSDFKYRWKETKSDVNTNSSHRPAASPNAPGSPCNAPPPPGNPFSPDSVNQPPASAC